MQFFLKKTMIVGILEVSLHIPAANSLKMKRKVIVSLKERMKRQFNISLSETDGQNTWQRCTLACAMVAVQRQAVEREFQHILDLIDAESSVCITDQWMDFF
ncbi:MAG: DUF503 domain-containing protein [Candidatus Omnitrophota bacterium]|nr:MAG: DUF503 domain-containing protein [Candidatus Omnitrophota bacterium]